MMVLTKTPICNFGEKIINFSLMNVDDRFYSLKELKGYNGTVVMFICNHCPYVKSIISRLKKTVLELKSMEVNSIAIMPNDTTNYPEDNFKNMKKFSNIHNFNFPYLLDENQNIAKEYGAVCTPDFFGYNNNGELQYRGRLSEMKNLEFVDERNELLDAMRLIMKTQKGPVEQYPSVGCSIKWKSN